MTTKTPLLFIPGMLCDGRLWRPLMTEYINENYNVSHQIIDHESIKEWASERVAELEGDTIIAGLSMGGYAALAIMRQLMEQDEQEKVRGLILMATSARADTPEQSRVRRGLIQLAKKGTFKGVTPKLLPTLIHASLVDEPEPAHTIFAMVNDLGSETFIVQETAVMQREDQQSILSDITCPTLVICGDSDLRTPPDCSEDMAKQIPNAEYCLIEQCGHLPPLEHAEKVQRIVEGWLRECD